VAAHRTVTVGNSVQDGLVIVLQLVLLMGKMAIASGFHQFGTGLLNKKEDNLVKPKRLAQRMTLHNNPRAAMPLALVIDGKFNFRALPERPFCEETDAFWRPMNLIPNQIDGIREAYPHPLFLVGPGFARDGHNLHL